MSASAPPTSFVKRRIDVTFRRARGVFAESGTNQVTLTGLRVSALVSQVGGQQQGSLDLAVYGLTRSMMNDLMFVRGAPLQGDTANAKGENDTVKIEAGSDGRGMALVYMGAIIGAFTDYTQAPNVAFRVQGIMAFNEALQSIAPSSYQGAADVAVIMQNLAKQMGLVFENSGVTGLILSNSYFPGSAYEQAERCAEHAKINMVVSNGTLAIWPRGGSRRGSAPLISPATGLVGYPRKTVIGVDFDTLYNPNIIFGGNVKIESSLLPACGTWEVKQLDHRLESETPGGAWFSHVVTNVAGLF